VQKKKIIIVQKFIYNSFYSKVFTEFWCDNKERIAIDTTHKFFFLIMS